MPAKIGQFFDIFILKQAVETQYLGGLDQFIADVGLGRSTRISSSSGHDTLVKAIKCLQEAHLNCDDSSNCVYVCTTHYWLPPFHSKCFAAGNDVCRLL